MKLIKSLPYFEEQNSKEWYGVELSELPEEAKKILLNKYCWKRLVRIGVYGAGTDAFPVV